MIQCGEYFFNWQQHYGNVDSLCKEYNAAYSEIRRISSKSEGDKFNYENKLSVEFFLNTHEAGVVLTPLSQDCASDLDKIVKLLTDQMPSATITNKLGEEVTDLLQSEIKQSLLQTR